MELRHFRYFVAVADEGHITRAAERLGMQQPPLSQRIRSIEQELGVRLFLRKPRGVELTQAGRAFLGSARAILAQYDHAFETTRRAARGEQGSLCVGVTPTSSFHPLVTMVIRSFREEFPQVSLTLEECLTAEMVERLKGEKMDIAFFRSEMAPPEGLAIRPLLTEPMVVALPSGHALVRRDGTLALRELINETFIMFARQQGPAFYEATVAACLSAGFSPRLGQEAPRVTSALALVAAGLGICLVPASMRRIHPDGVKFCDLKSSALKASLNLVGRRRDPSPVVQNFSTLVKQVTEQFTGRAVRRP
jgi:DNA-binding transcriptional LysR family regulator